ADATVLAKLQKQLDARAARGVARLATARRLLHPTDIAWIEKVLFDLVGQLRHVSCVLVRQPRLARASIVTVAAPPVVCVVVPNAQYSRLASCPVPAPVCPYPFSHASRAANAS